MSQTQTEKQFDSPQDALAHYGVKGMRWGVTTKSGERGKIRRGLTKANVSLDAGAKIIREGEKKLIFLPLKNRQDAASRTQTRMLGTARRVNKDPQFKGKDIKNNPELKRAYFERLKEEAKTIYAEELNISRTEAWGEFLSVDTTATTNQMRFNAAVDRIKHAEDGGAVTLLEMNFVTDDLGHVIDIKVPNKYLKHEMFEDNEFTLMHYGVKGMKWGVTNTDKAKAAVGRSKPNSSEIQSARAKIASKERRLNSQIDRTNLASGKKQEAEAKKLADLSTDYLKDPDRATALRMTNGEKFALGILAVGLPGIGTGVAAGVAGMQRAQRSAVEREQRKIANG